MKTVAQAMADCAKAWGDLAGPAPELMFMAPEDRRLYLASLSADKRERLREWSCTDQTPGVLKAFEELGAAMAYEREKRFWDAFERADEL